ncbi:hypothetical protein DK254_33060 [Pseudomonas sp. RW407]|uniref:hypothetical protein n=1 Tax=Pseudomonas sp. RW407 TaxID=2202894 RepID=UPI000D6F0400|nr:hypothetical protein [Pseudomonas sp. RW407]PWU27321.1 hypothetical protein DK254_33060 [Pseudomonas sp. RW407]
MNGDAKKPVTLSMLHGRLATIQRQDATAADLPLYASINGVGFALHSSNFQVSEKGALELSLSTKEVHSPALAGTQGALGAVLKTMDHARAEHSLQFGPLLNCPCCGCLAEQTDSECGHRVECTWCGLATEVEVEAAEARRTWNTRLVLTTSCIQEEHLAAQREAELISCETLQQQAYSQGMERVGELITSFRNAVLSEDLSAAIRAEQELREGVIEGFRMLQRSTFMQLNPVAWGRTSDLGRIVECRCAFTWKPHGDYVVPLYAAPVADVPDDVRRDIEELLCDVLQGHNSISAPDHAVNVAYWLHTGQSGSPPVTEQLPSGDSDAAVAAIAYALDRRTEETIEFLRLWNEGEFDVLRKEWPDAPEEVYIGANSLFKQEGQA